MVDVYQRRCFVSKVTKLLVITIDFGFHFNHWVMNNREPMVGIVYIIGYLFYILDKKFNTISPRQ